MKLFEQIELEVITLDCKDVITTSGVTVDTSSKLTDGTYDEDSLWWGV